MKRLPEESFEDYKIRRKASNISTGVYLRGRVVKPMRSETKIVKLFRKLERTFKDAPKLRQARLLKRAGKVEELIKEERRRLN